jgi:hypothetical protein
MSLLKKIIGPVKTVGLIGCGYWSFVKAGPRIADYMQKMIPEIKIGSNYITDDLSNLLTYGGITIAIRGLDVFFEKLVYDLKEMHSFPIKRSSNKY